MGSGFLEKSNFECFGSGGESRRRHKFGSIFDIGLIQLKRALACERRKLPVVCASTPLLVNGFGVSGVDAAVVLRLLNSDRQRPLASYLPGMI